MTPVLVAHMIKARYIARHAPKLTRSEIGFILEVLSRSSLSWGQINRLDEIYSRIREAR